MKTIVIAIVIASMVVTGSIVSFPTSAQRLGTIETDTTTPERTDDYQTVVSIPVETGTFAYQNLQKAEAVPYGPNSISITDTGSVLIGNWVDNTATEISLSGDIITKVKFDEATAINDVRKIHDRYYALDRTGDGTQVVSDIGEKILTDNTAFRFSAEDVSAEVGEIAVADLKGSENALVTQLKDRKLDNLTITSGRPFDTEANLLKVWRAGTLITQWTAVNPIAETRLLGSLPNGDFFVMVHEMIGTDRILFDQRVIHFDHQGGVIEMARVPQDQYYNVANDAALSAHGKVYILMPRENSLDIIQLNFTRDLPDLEAAPSTVDGSQPEAAALGLSLPSITRHRIEDGDDYQPQAAILAPLKSRIPRHMENGDEYQQEAAALALSLPSTTRQQIENVANYYFQTWTYIPASRVSGTCRVRPSYISGAGSQASVPYSWGGWDSPLDFANKMGASTVVLAGHVANYYSSCAVRPAGVDCSGFVGQTWKLPGHPFGTANVIDLGYARSIDWSQLRKGDALVKTGHMLLYVSGSYGNSFSTWEATGDYGAERALRWSRSWSEMRNYTPIRYNGLSVINPTARMSAISSYGVQWENSTGTYNVSPNGSIVFTFDAARSSANVGSLYSWTWKINGTQVSQASRFNFTLGRGTHNVSLAVTNTDGGISTSTLQVVVREVQIIVRPAISGYTWNSTPTANVDFSGTVYGTNFVVGGTRLFFCKANTSTCYEQPSSLISVTSATRLTVRNVRLSSGYWQMFARNAAGDSYRSALFYVR